MSKYKFKIQYGPDQIFVNPFGDVTLTWEQQEGTNYFRKKLSSFTLNIKEQYQFIKDVEEDGDLCTDFRVIVTSRCDTETIVEFNGTFTISDCEFDDHLCQVEIDPQPDDPFSCLKANESRIVNLLAITDEQTVDADVQDNVFVYNAPGTETVLRVPNGDPAPDVSVLAPYVGDPAELDLIKIQKLDPDIGLTYDHYVAWAYRRSVPKVGSGCQPTLSSGYELIASNATHCFYQKLPSSVDFLDIDRASCGSEFPTPPPPGWKPPWSVDIWSGVWLDEDPIDGICVWYRPFQGTYDRARRLDDCLDAFLSDCDITVKSDFFQINPENVSGTNYVTGMISRTANIHFLQKSDAIYFDSTEPATNGKTTWKDFWDGLSKIFNLGYTIEDNTIVIEHISFFDNIVSVLDLTQDPYEKYITGQKKYAYKKETLPFIETIQQSDWINEDFEPSQIIYEGSNGKKLGCVGDKEENIAWGIFTTDLQYYQEVPEGVGLDGWVVLCCAVPTMATPIPYVFNEVGLKSGFNQINGHIAVTNAVNHYYLHGRYAETGKIDGVQTDFETNIKKKEADPIDVVICCEDHEFDPNESIKTHLGVGSVTEATKNLKTGSFNLKIEY